LAGDGVEGLAVFWGVGVLASIAACPLDGATNSTEERSDA
jgi:hypothetical protein